MIIRGIGNLIGMPIAIAVGRRIVLLGATTIMLVGAILCAFATNFEWHLRARMLIGFAAGQSEALVPMITQVSPISQFKSALSRRARNLIVSYKSRKYSFFMRGARSS
jgi:predicted MFS family arabinose efflux permease